jgi:hypothetical protein
MAPDDTTPTDHSEDMTSGAQGGRDPSAARDRGQVVTWRAIAIALLIMPFQSTWIVHMEAIRNYTWPSMLALPLETVFVLLLLTAASAAIKRRRPRWALSQGELLTIYIMLAIGGVIVGFGLLEQVISWAIAPVGRATKENQWDQLFWQHLPSWLVLTNVDSLEALFRGDTTLLTRRHVASWMPVVLSWGGFFLAFFAVMMAMNTLLRRRWIEEERLTFPLVQLPLAVTEPTGRIFRNWLLWAGFGLAFVLGTLNGLHALFPAMPSFQPDLGSLNAHLGRRWSCFAKHGGPFWPPYPWAIGVAVFMPLEVSFSYWFFFWVVKLEELATVLTGWDIAPDAPFVYQQSAAALLAIGVYIVWAARKHFWSVVAGAIHPSRDLGDRREPIPYRAAIALFVAAIGFLCIFVWRAGMPVWLVPIFLSLYLSASLALSRIPAELGAPANEIHDAGPHQILTQIATPASFPVRGLVALTLLGWTSRSYGVDPTPHQMGGFKMAERTGLRTRGLAGAMFVAAVAGLVYGYLALLLPLYQLGADSSKLHFNTSGQYAFGELETWLTGVAPATGYRSTAMGFGFLFTLFLYAMRSRFLWWPFHPMGYLMAPTWFTHHLWLPVFLAWLAKLLLLRYGGLRTYAAALPFFFGLIIGDCVIGSLWALANLVFGAPTFAVWM